MIRRWLWELRQRWRRAWRPQKQRFVTTTYENPSVVVRGQKVEIVKEAGERFPTITVDGAEVDWKSFTLAQSLPAPCVLTVETLVR